MENENPAIIVMAKTPGAGNVKTRLRPLLSETQCISLAESFLLDTIARLENNPEKIIIAFSPASGIDEMRSLVGDKHRQIPQTGDDLGERLKHAVAAAFDMGCAPVVVIGTDSPTLPLEYLSEAFEHLSKAEKCISIGPAEDGGYYLIGMSKPNDAIFENITWSSDKVFEQTLANIKNSDDLNLQILPCWFDVDEPQDLARLMSELKSNGQNGRYARRTAIWLEEHKLMLEPVLV